jgi:ribose transport system ATP-binding protein
MAGLIGAGRTDVARTIFGANQPDAGRIFLGGREVKITSPKDAMARGIAYLSENRRGDGLFLGMDVRENVTVSHLQRFSRLGFVNFARERAGVQRFVDRLRVQTPSLDQRVLNLSGGNQQKVILARWLAIEPAVLIVDEPTRGIDVGAKAEIYALLHQLAGQGVAILMVSSDMPEVLGMSDRILVMHEGRITASLSRGEASEERIMTHASGQEVAPAIERR